MSQISYRSAQPGDEIQLAELHFLAFKDSIGYTFPFPNFEQHKSYFIKADLKRYADHISKKEVLLAVTTVEGEEQILGCAMWRLPDENGNTQHGLDSLDERTDGLPKEAVDTYRQNIKTEEILKRREFYFPNHIMRKELMVHPSYQGQRIATRLLEQVHNLATQQKLPVLVRAYAGSAKLHEKMGYQTLAKWRIEDARKGKEDGYENCVQVLNAQSPRGR